MSDAATKLNNFEVDAFLAWAARAARANGSCTTGGP